ncbi:MAG TPA: pilus assembly protein TadG-related protein [Caulobacteraceae bacterium]|nr:pilus assembly protein TadG-related protein [Caulobacteraceae bacterium]
MFNRILGVLMRRREGSVSIISAVTLPLLIAMTGLVAEYGNGLMHKVEDQRVADAAAFAAATAYNANSSASLTSVAAAVAGMNGLTAADVSASLVTSPSGDGNQAVKVAVATQVPLMLSRILGNSASELNVAATSYAELKGGAPGCIIALSSSGTGVTLSGGTSVSADACAVASDYSVTVPCGTSITSIAVDYDSAGAPSEPCSGIQPPSGGSLAIRHAATADPLAGSSVVATATARLSSVAGLGSPSGPSLGGGTSVDFGYGAVSLPGGCSETYASGTHTVTCTGDGPFDFGAITTGGGITVRISATGSAPVFNINGSIQMTGTSMTWGPGTYNISGGILTGGGTTTSFGAGAFHIGAGSFSCNGSKGYSICNTGTRLSFGGPSSFVTQGGIYNSGGETLTLGAGSTNSFDIGKASDGNSYVGGGGADTSFGDATGSGDLFQMAGNLDVSSGGGSCLTLSAAAQHDINGFFSSAGGTVMGAGVYTISDYFALGPNGGGDVSCNGASVGLTGTNVTLVIGAATTLSSGTCAGEAFCMGAGYSNVTLLAPTTGATANLAVIGPQSGDDGATLAEGASGADFSGAFYFPTEAISMSGGSSLGSFGSSQCLMLIGSQVTLTGGAALASSCSGIGAAATSTVVLVQ